MPAEFSYSTAILIIALLFASAFLGLVIGYFFWGSVKGRLRQLTQENSKRQEHINQLAGKINSMKAQLELVE